MSNTYFRIKRVKTYDSFDSFPTYTNEMELSLTATIQGEDCPNAVQITIQTQSTAHNQSGTAFITLSDKDALKLAHALLERVNGNISATGYEETSIEDCKP
jgi:hypothetical protein